MGATVDNMDFSTGRLVPIETESKNDLPRGTVLKLYGYHCPKYVIIDRLDIDTRFGHGAMYRTVDIDTYAQSRHDALTLSWPSDKKVGIHTEITDKILPENEVAEIWAKSEESRKSAEVKKAESERIYSELSEKGKVLFAKYIPADAPALIIAEHHIDESDITTDYFHHSVKETIVLAWSSHKRDLFSEMRKAAALIPETAHLGPGKGHFEARVYISETINANGSYYHKGGFSHWHHDIEYIDGKLPVFGTREEAQAHIDKMGEPESISFDGQIVPFSWNIDEKPIEHREKYSMGEGYYLKDGHRNSSEWCVKKVIKYRENDTWAEYYASMAERCIFEKSKTSDITQPSKVESVTVTVNAEKNGIEIRFPQKPAQATIDLLKLNGWRWSRFGSCWYNRDNEQNRLFSKNF